MSKVNLNIAYLGQKGANINLGKIDDIEITSPDNTVEVVNKKYDEATKVLTFELKAGSINDVEITSSDNSVEVVSREYNVETKVLTLDLKAAKSLSITSEDETVKVTEKNGKVDLGVKQVSVAPLDATTTVELNTDASGNDIYKVGAFSSHTIVERIDISTTEHSNGRWLQSYKVKCAIVDQEFEFFDTNTMEDGFSNNLNAKNTKAIYNVEKSAEPQYIMYQAFSSTASMHKTKLTIEEDGKKPRVYYIAGISDTAGSSGHEYDAAFTFITDLNWEIKGYIKSNQMRAVITVPAGFSGKIRSEMVYYHKFQGGYVTVVGYEGNELKSYEIEKYDRTVDLRPHTAEELASGIAGYTDAEKITSEIAPNAGRYKVDCLFPLDGWEVGKKIPDSFPNDLMLHQLQLYVEQLQEDYAHLVRQINFTSSDGSINVNPIEGGGTDYTVNWTKLLANGILEITDDNKSDYYDSATGIISNIPPNTQTIAFNTSLVEEVKAIQGGNYNGRRITLVGSYTMSNEYADTDTDGRFSRYLLGYRYGVPGGEIAYSLDELFEDFVYFNGIWFSKGY